MDLFKDDLNKIRLDNQELEQEYQYFTGMIENHMYDDVSIGQPSDRLKKTSALMFMKHMQAYYYIKYGVLLTNSKVFDTIKLLDKSLEFYDDELTEQIKHK
jgi:hypothetical protein